MTSLGLAALDRATPDVARPAYAPRDHGTGIVHLGCGNFHRAHQAIYTDDALAAAGGDWRIASVSLRSTEIADALNPQDGLYTVIERGQGGTRARIVGSIAGVIAAQRNPRGVLSALADPRTRIVTLTVTEKAYGIDRSAMDIDESHAAIAADLAAPKTPSGAIGLLVEALRRRFEAGTLPFTVLCCDNLPENGKLLRAGVIGFARRLDAGLAERIEGSVAFPSSMVDRITPAATEETRSDARRLTGLTDEAAVETEPFSQWVIEDRFPTGRPAWEAGGALFVEDVAPYEAMKLRMLNGAHSMLAYAGFLAGHASVREVMVEAALAHLVRRHLDAAARTLPHLPGVDLAAYGDQLATRFSNPAIAHLTYQIAMDGTEKLPQRIVAPALDALEKGQSIRPFAFAVAAWMRYCTGRTEGGEPYDLRDPREAAIRSAVEGARGEPSALVDALLGLPGVFDPKFTASEPMRSAIRACLATMLTSGMRQAIEQEAGGA